MEKIFFTLLEISAGTSVVILVVRLLSARINRTFVARWKYWLWLVLAVRLLIPWNPDFSAAPARVEMNIPEVSISAPAQPPQEISPTSPAAPGVSPGLSETAAAPMTTIDLLWSLWILGMVLFGLWHLLSYLHFQRNVFRWSRPVEKESPLAAALGQVSEAMGVGAGIRLLFNNQLQSPLMFGFFRPVLVLPRRDYQREELFFILRHELTHYKRRDIWYKALLLAANTVHWFNPVIWLMVRNADRDLEISCDAAVVAGADKETRRRYSEVILANIRREPLVATVLSTHFYGGKETMKERFANILNTKKRRAGVVVFAAVLLSVLLIGGLVACGAQPEEPSEPSQSDSPAVSTADDQEVLEAALEAITLENYPHSNEETIEKFKDHVHSLSIQEALELMKDEQMVAYMLNPSYWTDPEVEAALETITLENYPYSSENAIQQFKNYVLSQPTEDALTLLQDQQMVAYMLNPSYWTDPEVEAALEAITPQTYPDASQEVLDRLKDYIRTLSKEEALALLGSPDQLAPMLEESYWGIEPEPESQGFTATAANSWDYAPDQSGIPTDQIWATEDQLDAYQQLISGLNLSGLTNLTALNIPGSTPQSVPMSEEDAAWIVSQLSGLELAVTQPKNPATGGALSICLQGPETNVTISYEGEMLVIAQAGQSSAVIFDGAACAETMDAIWAMVMGMV